MAFAAAELRHQQFAKHRRGILLPPRGDVGAGQGSGKDERTGCVQSTLTSAQSTRVAGWMDASQLMQGQMLWLHCMLAYGKGSGSRRMLCAVHTACMPGRPLSRLDLSSLRVRTKDSGLFRHTTSTEHKVVLCCAISRKFSSMIVWPWQRVGLCFWVAGWQCIVPGMYVCTPVPCVFLCSDV
jgi:hypothetical protein